MNDEVALAHRSRGAADRLLDGDAARAGALFRQPRWTISLREGLRILTDVTIAAALIRYAWLELR